MATLLFHSQQIEQKMDEKGPAAKLDPADMPVLNCSSPSLIDDLMNGLSCRVNYTSSLWDCCNREKRFEVRWTYNEESACDSRRVVV